MIQRDKLRAQLTVEEKDVPVVYDDATGKPIVAGTVVRGNPTIGIGRLLTKPMSRAARDFLFNEDVNEAMQGLNDHLPWWLTLDEVRQRVLVDMVFNMGIGKVQRFPQTLAAIKSGNYSLAADMMLESLWAHQVGGRATTLAQMMRSGKDLV